MDKFNFSRPAPRQVLQDGTGRANIPAGPLRSDRNEHVRARSPPRSSHHDSLQVPARPGHSLENPRHSTVSKDTLSTVSADQSRRVSQVSADSNASTTNSSTFRKLKTHVGPWELGKTLGKGSSARVRLARHHITQQLVAVKIVSKSICAITQAQSMARLDKIDGATPDNAEGLRRMPVALEREVAILKLIEHPSVVKIFDIWENRNEIYLIMEYCEEGDLYDWIRRNGPLPEEQVIYVFRQLMSAVEYFHAYGICHRDLKPENILLSGDGKIKIADFGMAALHQTPNFLLHTACGSPHYAPPELLRSKAYRGEKSDIWSMGVTLYAIRAGCHPFEDDDLRVMIAKAKKGIYDMPSTFSMEMKDFVHRLIQVDPNVRLTIPQMWKHPLIWKYGYLDDLGPGESIPKPRLNGDIKPLDLCNIDPQILRQLRAMWNTFSEQEVIAKLISQERNDQRLFYWLLHNYRERQMENYNPDLAHSMSDYHHMRPTKWTQRVSTRQFSHSKASGHGRSVSRFTVISNVPDAPEAGAEMGTIRSYDPYKSSLVLRPQASHARILVHRDQTDQGRERASKSSSSVLTKRRRRSSSGGRKPTRRPGVGSSKYPASLSSMSSAPSSKQGYSTLQTVRAKSRAKRGVDFSALRRLPTARQRYGLKAPASIAGDETTYDRDVCSPSSPHKPSDHSVQVTPSKSRGRTVISNEEIRHFSSDIAKDCDEAFNSSLLSVSILPQTREGSPFSLSLGPPTPGAESALGAAHQPGSHPQAHQAFQTPQPRQATSAHPWDSRPLPPIPSKSGSRENPRPSAPAFGDKMGHTQSGGPTNGETQALVSKSRNQSCAAENAYGLGTNTSHATHFARPDGHNQAYMTPAHGERRVVSAPAHGQYGAAGWYNKQLPSINENSPEPGPSEKGKHRNISAPNKPPAPTPGPCDSHGFDFLAKADRTIRVVNSPSAKPPAPNLRTPVSLQAAGSYRMPATMAAGSRRASAGSGASSNREQEAGGQNQPLEGLAMTLSRDSGSALAKQKTPWFRRLSKESTDSKDCKGSGGDAYSASAIALPQRAESRSTGPSGTISSSSEAAPLPEPPVVKKKGFFFQFWKSSKSDPKMSIPGPEYSESPSPEDKVAAKTRNFRGPLDREEEEEAVMNETRRTGATRQSWFARLFSFKPATRNICLSISKRRARQELAIMLREWRKYGIRDIVVDREHNIVTARVTSRNHLRLREVSFSCEIITVIEHGKRNHLSIVRFTQLRGAASSFYKVVALLQIVLKNRAILVTDKKKAKMMIKTLNSPSQV